MDGPYQVCTVDNPTQLETQLNELQGSRKITNILTASGTFYIVSLPLEGARTGSTGSTASTVAAGS